MRPVTISPVEYVIIEFPGDASSTDVAPAIADLVERGVVRILDLLFVKKDEDGTVSTFEYDELDEGAAFADVDGDVDGMFGDDDVEVMAADLAPGSSALFVMFEDLWASELGQAVWAAGGELIAGGRIPRSIVEEAVAAFGADADEEVSP
jgi:uncharacterized membrane protein